MNSSVKFITLPFLFLSLVILSNVHSADPFENYVRRNVPTGYTMSAFVETCEACGVLYGNDFTYKCLADKSMITFKGCYVAVHNRR